MGCIREHPSARHPQDWSLSMCLKCTSNGILLVLPPPPFSQSSVRFPFWRMSLSEDTLGTIVRMSKGPVVGKASYANCSTLCLVQKNPKQKIKPKAQKKYRLRRVCREGCLGLYCLLSFYLCFFLILFFLLFTIQMRKKGFFLGRCFQDNLAIYPAPE